MDASWFAELATSLEASTVAAALREKAWPYPLANLLHVLGVALLIGPIVALDLRLLGVCKFSVSADGAASLLVPVAVLGLVIAIPSGSLLFVVEAVPLSRHPLMQVKGVLILLGLMNALLLQIRARPRLRWWDEAPPAGGRWQAAFSLLTWVGAAVCGRLIAYV